MAKQQEVSKLDQLKKDLKEQLADFNGQKLNSTDVARIKAIVKNLGGGRVTLNKSGSISVETEDGNLITVNE